MILTPKEVEKIIQDAFEAKGLDYFQTACGCCDGIWAEVYDKDGNEVCKIEGGFSIESKISKEKAKARSEEFKRTWKKSVEKSNEKRMEEQTKAAMKIWEETKKANI